MILCCDIILFPLEAESKTLAGILLISISQVVERHNVLFKLLFLTLTPESFWKTILLGFVLNMDNDLFIFIS